MMVKLFNSKPMHFCIYRMAIRKSITSVRFVFSVPPKHDETISSSLDDSALFFIAYALRKRNY